LHQRSRTRRIAGGRVRVLDLQRGQALRVYIEKQEKYFYDWLSSEWRVDGQAQNADELAILRISGT